MGELGFVNLLYEIFSRISMILDDIFTERRRDGYANRA